MLDRADTGQAYAAGKQRRVLLTDHPWPDVDLERAIFADADLELVAGPEAAGTVADIEALVEQHDPVAIMTCWAHVSAQAISMASDLAIVARLGVGLDNIDVTAATARGTWVSNVPDYCVGEVSDHAIALILAHHRGIARLDRLTKADGWRSDGTGLERVADLVVAIIGYGRIGRETARKLRAFGCRVMAISPRFEDADEWAEPADIERAQREADVIVLHAPLTPRTAGLIGDEFIRACRRRPLLVNVSRGGLVDNAALVAGLDDGLLRGAALDVVDGEPSPPDTVTSRSDVIVTPHVAFASTASLAELRRRACEEVVRALRGEALEHPCNLLSPGTPLEGGVASDIRIVTTPRGPEVVKRALAKLKVAADWFSDPARSSIEVAAIDACVRLMGQEHLPEILWVKPAENTFAMRLVDARLRNWKLDLLAGHVDLATARSVGDTLGRLHDASSGDPNVRSQFADLTYFQELRIEPFFLQVAKRNPDLAAQVLAVVAAMEARRTALVHGDFSPKNILADGADLVILDFEVAHWGDPRFDVAFCVAHLLLKGLRRDVDRQPFAAAISAFLQSYGAVGPQVLDAGLGQVTGCLLLARIDGKSPVDYVADLDANQVRSLARRLLSPTASPIDDILQEGLQSA